MKFKRNEKYASVALYAFITICASVLLCLGIANFGSVKSAFNKLLEIIAPLTYGFAIAYLCAPLMSFIEKNVFRFKKSKKDRAKLRRILSLILTYIIVSAFICMFFILLVPQIVQSYDDLTRQVGSYVASAQSLADDFVRNFSLFNGKYENFSDFLDVNELSSDITSIITNSYSYLETISNYILDYAGKFVIGVKNIIIALILAVYFLYYKEKLSARLKKLLQALVKRKTYLNIVNLTRYAHEMFGSFITGKLLDSLIIGLLTFIVTGIFGIPYYPLISLIIGITNVIPVFGPFIGAIPTAFIVLIVDPGKFLIFLIIVFVIQQLDGNIIGPKVLGDSIGISAMWVMISIIVGGGLFGITGMILGVPAFAVIYALIRQESEKRLKKRGFPSETDFYSNDPPHVDFSCENVFLEKGDEIPEHLRIERIERTERIEKEEHTKNIERGPADLSSSSPQADKIGEKNKDPKKTKNTKNTKNK